MRKADLSQKPDSLSVSDSEARGCPLADAVYRENGCLVEPRGIKRARRVRSMVIDEQDLARLDAKPIAEVVSYPELIPEPRDHGFAESVPGSRVALKHRHQDALEFDEGLFVKDDVIEILRLDAGGLEAKLDGTFRVAGIVLLPRESLFFRCTNEPPVIDERRGRIVIETGDSEDLHASDFGGMGSAWWERGGDAVRSKLFTGILQGQRLTTKIAPLRRRFPRHLEGIDEELDAKGKGRHHEEIQDGKDDPRLKAPDLFRKDLPALPCNLEQLAHLRKFKASSPQQVNLPLRNDIALAISVL